MFWSSVRLPVVACPWDSPFQGSSAGVRFGGHNPLKEPVFKKNQKNVSGLSTRRAT